MKIKSFNWSILSLVLVFALSSCQSATSTEEAADATEETPAAQTVSNTPTEEPAAIGVKVGDKAPAFSLKNVDGEMYGLPDVKDANGNAAKGVVLTFTCNTCPYAVAYEDRLIELHNKLAPMGYPVVAIQPNDPEVKEGDSFSAMQVRHQEKSFPFLYLIDEGQKVYPLYGASRTPEVYLVDADGTVRYHGAIDDNAQDETAVTKNYVEMAVAAIEAGQDPDPADVKAIGCTIKTKKI